MTTDLRIGHLAGIVAVLAAVPVLALGGAAAQAAGGGITVFPGINQPNDITTGPDAALWFTDYGNNSIGRITTTGKITTYTGGGINGPDDITAGPDGALWFTNYGGNSFGSPAATRSGGSPPPARSPLTPAPGWYRRTQSPPDPAGRCGSPASPTRSARSPPPPPPTQAQLEPR